MLDFLDSPEDFNILYKGSKVAYLNEAGTPSDNSVFFIAGHKHGPTDLIHVESYRGDGFETAWEAWIDSCPSTYDDARTEYEDLHNPSHDLSKAAACIQYFAIAQIARTMLAAYEKNAKPEA